MIFGTEFFDHIFSPTINTYFVFTEGGVSTSFKPCVLVLNSS